MSQEVEAAIAMSLSLANRHEGHEFNPALVAEINALEEDLLPEAYSTLAERLIEVENPVGAGYLAIFLGAQVEGGSDPLSSGWHLLMAMMKWTRTIITDDESDAASAPDEDLLFGLEHFGRGVVAHFTRSPELHDRLVADESIQQEIFRLEHLSNGCMWLAQILRQTSGEITMLHVASRRGVRVKYENLSNAFHFFTIFQSRIGEVIPGAQAAPDHVISAALGESENQNGQIDCASWHYGQATSPTAELMASVWGEGSLEEVAEIDGEKVILLWPKIMENRTWDSGFFGPIIHSALPNVEILKVLEKREVEEWFERLGTHVRTAKKPFWKFW